MCREGERSFLDGPEGLFGEVSEDGKLVIRGDLNGHVGRESNG